MTMVPRTMDGSASSACLTTSWYQPGKSSSCRGSAMARRIACYGPPMAVTVPVEVERFTILHQDVEAVIQRCGLNTFDCVFIDVQGNWTRAVFPSREAAEEACRDLEVPAHD